MNCKRTLLLLALCAVGANAEYWPPFLSQGEAAPVPPADVAADADVMTVAGAEMAGISGAWGFWDTPVPVAADGALTQPQGVAEHFGVAPVADWSQQEQPGAAVFDAVHRGLLVRFPDVARVIGEKAATGAMVVRAEILLPFLGTEYFPLEYTRPAGMSFLGDTWVKRQPTWHAVAWALRRPWQAGRERGPTYNAAAAGITYWGAPGAADTHTDRFAQHFGPAEVSQRHPVGILDITAALTDPAFGATPGERVAQLRDQGFLIRKWEIYDAKMWTGSYEWGTCTGGRGIRVGEPTLRLTFAPHKPITLDLPVTPASIRSGTPGAVIPTREQYEIFKQRFGLKQPAHLADWQWQRVQELLALGGGRHGFPESYEAYLNVMKEVVSDPPRRWSGFDAAERLQTILLYRDAWPQPVVDAAKLYWWAWLLPDRKMNFPLVQGYIGREQADAYYRETQDWRGNFSVYRTYCYAMGTMNFNHWAAAGTLLGGVLLDSPFLEAEGRHGLERFPLRTWCWYDGSTQESIDHYYLSHSLVAQKTFADLAAHPVDRMMGQSILGKTVEELAVLFHPNLRRFTSPSGRTGIDYVLCTQEGLQYILHTLSKKGALTDFGRKPEGKEAMAFFGQQFAPGMAAVQAVNGEWAPRYTAAFVDDKTLPFETTVSFKQWGAYTETPLWRRSWIGHWYGMASADAGGSSTVPFLVHWARQAKPVEHFEEIGTLLCRYGMNRTELIDSVFHGTETRNPNGIVGTQGGPLAVVQYRNKALVLASPTSPLATRDRQAPAAITSLQTTIGLFNFEAQPTWRLYLDGQAVDVTALPLRFAFGQKLVVHDGVSYVLVIPLPGTTDLGRDAKVVLSDDGVPTGGQGSGRIREALRLNAYNFRSDTALADLVAAGTLTEQQVDAAFGGFYIEAADVTEFADIGIFLKHAEAVAVSVVAAEETITFAVNSGDDTLDVVYNPLYTKGPTTGLFPRRLVNGAWPYLPTGIERDTSLTQQGDGGRLEKNGAELTTRPGAMAYLQTEPASGCFAAGNPFPEPIPFALTLPGGVTITANGNVGICRIVADLHAHTLRIDHQFKPNEQGAGLATAFVVRGLAKPPAITLNDTPVAAQADETGGLTVPLP